MTANEARSWWAGGAPWIAASTKYPESNSPGDWALELLEVLRRRQRAAELRDAGLQLAEPADELAGRADRSGEAGLQLARSARELAEAGLERGGAGRSARPARR